MEISSHKYSQYSKDEIYRIELTPQQHQFMLSVLPKNYSFQLDHRKENKSVTRRKNADQFIQNSASEQNISSSKIQSRPKVQPPPPQKPVKDLISESLKPCQKILQMLMQYKNSWPFAEPVDAEGLNIPEYRLIVKEPMDLQTMDNKLKAGKYQNPAQFHADVVKIISNSYLFNELNQDFIRITNQFQKYYYRISGEVKAVVVKPVLVQKSLQTSQSKPQKKKKKIIAGSRQFNDSQPITLQQKKELAYNIHRLAKEHIKGVRSIVFETNSDQNQFDLEQLSQKKIRELQKYVRSKISDMENNLRFNLNEKSQNQMLDEMESDVSAPFLDEMAQ